MKPPKGYRREIAVKLQREYESLEPSLGTAFSLGRAGKMTIPSESTKEDRKHEVREKTITPKVYLGTGYPKGLSSLQ